MGFKHEGTVAGTLRWSFRILSPLNDKTPKGEKAGYLQAIVYLAPHDLAGGKTVCPHSTAACRAGCLYSAGRGSTPRVQKARLRRTRDYLGDREAFLTELADELETMQRVADQRGMKLAIRLNGTSDIGWEREEIAGRTLFELFPKAQFFDYTRWPPQHRRVPANWHLTFSLADDPLDYAVGHLRAGRSVAAVVPEWEKSQAPEWFALGDTTVTVVDGEQHDLRFLDPSPSLVLLKPKGRLRQGGPMVRSALIWNLIHAAKETA
jgi:hypothetical protein